MSKRCKPVQKDDFTLAVLTVRPGVAATYNNNDMVLLSRDDPAVSPLPCSVLVHMLVLHAVMGTYYAASRCIRGCWLASRPSFPGGAQSGHVPFMHAALLRLARPNTTGSTILWLPASTRLPLISAPIMPSVPDSCMWVRSWGRTGRPCGRSTRPWASLRPRWGSRAWPCASA